MQKLSLVHTWKRDTKTRARNIMTIIEVISRIFWTLCSDSDGIRTLHTIQFPQTWKIFDLESLRWHLASAFPGIRKWDSREWRCESCCTREIKNSFQFMQLQTPLANTYSVLHQHTAWSHGSFFLASSSALPLCIPSTTKDLLHSCLLIYGECSKCLDRLNSKHIFIRVCRGQFWVVLCRLRPEALEPAKAGPPEPGLAGAVSRAW